MTKSGTATEANFGSTPGIRKHLLMLSGLIVCLPTMASASAGQLAALPSPAEMSRMAEAALKGDGAAAYGLFEAYATTGDLDRSTKWLRLSVQLRYVYGLEYQAARLVDSNDYCSVKFGVLLYSEIFSVGSQWPHNGRRSTADPLLSSEVSGWKKGYRTARSKLSHMKAQDCSKSVEFVP